MRLRQSGDGLTHGGFALAGFEDVQTAIRWVKAHAAEFKGDQGATTVTFEGK